MQTFINLSHYFWQPLKIQEFCSDMQKRVVREES